MPQLVPFAQVLLLCLPSLILLAQSLLLRLPRLIISYHILSLLTFNVIAPLSIVLFLLLIFMSWRIISTTSGALATGISAPKCIRGPGRGTASAVLSGIGSWPVAGCSLSSTVS